LETGCGAVYDSRMSGDATSELCVFERAGSAGRVEVCAGRLGDAVVTVHDVDGRVVERIETRPSLFEPLHRPFALGSGDRIAARALLALLRFPGGARLLRLWHAKRSP
jgi:hypothetical protein